MGIMWVEERRQVDLQERWKGRVLHFTEVAGRLGQPKAFSSLSHVQVGGLFGLACRGLVNHACLSTLFFRLFHASMEWSRQL